MKRIFLGMGLLVCFVQCQEVDSEQTAISLLGTWQHEENATTIRFDQNQTYTVQFTPQAYFQMSYHLDELNQLVLYDSLITQTYLVEFIGSDRLQLTGVTHPTRHDMKQNRGIFHRAK